VLRPRPDPRHDSAELGGALGFELPYQLYLMLPYAMAIVALVLVARRAAYPQALMKPYRKGER
jgi:simple sugar transport system permease protein